MQMIRTADAAAALIYQIPKLLLYSEAEIYHLRAFPEFALNLQDRKFLIFYFVRKHHYLAFRSHLFHFHKS